MVFNPTKPAYPVLGIPVGEKLGPRADFRVTEFDKAIESMGYLLAWSRACPCPCAPVSEGSTQPDPNCTLCHGNGWFYFGTPVGQDQNLSAYQLDTVQQYLITRDRAMVIRGIITGVGTQPNPWDRLTNWMPGSSMLTVRAANQLGYYDRVTALDSQIEFAETVVADGTAVLALRYPACGVNLIRSMTRVYHADSEYLVSDLGAVQWFPAAKPPVGTRLSVHYLCHPTWLVVEHPHVMRITTVQQKVAAPKTPLGDARFLPIQALVRLDFIPTPEGTSAS